MRIRTVSLKEKLSWPSIHSNGVKPLSFMISLHNYSSLLLQICYFNLYAIRTIGILYSLKLTTSIPYGLFWSSAWSALHQLRESFRHRQQGAEVTCKLFRKSWRELKCTTAWCEQWCKGTLCLMWSVPVVVPHDEEFRSHS